MPLLLQYVLELLLSTWNVVCYSAYELSGRLLKSRWRMAALYYSCQEATLVDPDNSVRFSVT